MTIDKDGLAAAAIQLASLRGMSVADEVDQAMFGADAAKVVTAYLSALPDTGDELVARLRQVPRHEGHSYPVEGAIRVVPYGNMLNDAADAIASLTARAQAAEASLASAREDALEEAAKVADDHAEAWGLAMGQQAKEIAAAIRTLKGVQQ